MIRLRLRLRLLLLLVAFPSAAQAHQSTPCLLNIVQVQADVYELSWKTPPPTGPGAYPVSLAIPDAWEALGAPSERSLADGDQLRQSLRIPPPGIDGSVVRFPGLESIVTEVFVRVTRLDGSSYSAIVRSTDPQLELRGERGAWRTVQEFIVMGFEHILHGVDHLLFVFGLLLIVSGTMPLIKTISAFTLAHSLTLAMAALGFVNLPPAPIEALIALSILFLGPEVVHKLRGESSLAIRLPWLVAFSFGLLHGFGFAGGMNLIGMPHSEIPLALLCFNVGVELGQLAFVAAVFALLIPLRKLRLELPAWLRPAPAYLIGVSGAFWFIQRSYLVLFRQ